MHDSRKFNGSCVGVLSGPTRQLVCLVALRVSAFRPFTSMTLDDKNASHQLPA